MTKNGIDVIYGLNISGCLGNNQNVIFLEFNTACKRIIIINHSSLKLDYT